MNNSRVKHITDTLNDKDDKLCEMEKYQKDLEGIIKRQHSEMAMLRYELCTRRSELNKKNVTISLLESKCKENELSMGETKVKVNILMRKVRDLGDEIEMMNV